MGPNRSGARGGEGDRLGGDINWEGEKGEQKTKNRTDNAKPPLSRTKQSPERLLTYTKTQDPIENHESSNWNHQPIPTAIINIIEYLLFIIIIIDWTIKLSLGVRVVGVELRSLRFEAGFFVSEFSVMSFEFWVLWFECWFWVVNFERGFWISIYDFWVLSFMIHHRRLSPHSKCSRLRPLQSFCMIDVRVCGLVKVFESTAGAVGSLQIEIVSCLKNMWRPCNLIPLCNIYLLTCVIGPHLKRQPLAKPYAVAIRNYANPLIRLHHPRNKNGWIASYMYLLTYVHPIYGSKLTVT